MVYGAHDTAAALMKGGEILAACEQERYSLVKHCRDFPSDAIEDCLRLGGVELTDVDEIGFCNDPLHYIRENYLKTALKDDERIGFMIKDFDRIERAYQMENLVREHTGYQGPVNFHRHHLCHLASAYYPSGFDECLLACYDGMGEFQTGMLGIGRKGDIEIVHPGADYPHSLGLVYSAMTYYLGFQHHCDEGIVMGLAPYGDADATVPGTERSYYEVFEEIIRETGPLDYEINTDWLAYYRVRDTWIEEKFTDMFGPKRERDSEITDAHKNLAAALQKRLETIICNQLIHARDTYNIHRLAVSGGVGLNCSMNGKIESAGIFDEIFVQPASGDSGTAVGACYQSLKNQGFELQTAQWHDFYLGSGFDDNDVESASADCGVPMERQSDIYSYTAEKLAEGKIIAWFQGRSEFGPRALGNRSILTRPYPAEMKDYLNARVKFREYFRPFAPAVLAEHVDAYFQIGQESPHMLIACQAQPDKASDIPAVVHTDGSCRVQTVKSENNPRFRKLLEAFHAKTDCPVLLNTSFNVKGQPIVNTPKQAIECFASTNIDVLIVGDYAAEKDAAVSSNAA
ncbi:MAG TPA: carbamoyl transferase [Rhodospirillaceae bacterium]|nr:carbamoyl transferase [Rhodospirillaceae bacterium]HAA91892.1 carbamoyl transferase [Rhodospirillaceae bacterium]HAT35740.1 carbamoyl transferase [Rhodospirillaceae bacterium]